MPIDSRTSVEFSQAVNEPLYGTTSPASIFFLLEYNGIYTNRAWEDAAIPAEVKAKLASYGKALLIKQPGQLGEVDRTISLFIVDLKHSAIYRYSCYAYEELLTLDIEAVLLGNLLDTWRNPLYIVCTNGKRDICCSRYGLEVYNSLVSNVGDEVWQSSHLGGHRFAGTFYAFPQGVCYGFVSSQNAPSILAAHQAGNISLSHYRGRAQYREEIQVAEYHLRRYLHEEGLDAVQWLSYESSDNEHMIGFQVGDKPYLVRLANAEALMVLSTTGDEQYKAIPQWKLVEISAEV